MTKSEFDSLVALKKQQRPVWFELAREPPASATAIVELEAALGVHLPRQFREFLATHGAGTFAFLRVLGVTPGTGWELTSHRQGLPSDFIPCADLETGDYYGHRVVDGRCDEQVSVWDHETSSVLATHHEDFYALVAAVGLSH